MTVFFQVMNGYCLKTYLTYMASTKVMPRSIIPLSKVVWYAKTIYQTYEKLLKRAIKYIPMQCEQPLLNFVPHRTREYITSHATNLTKIGTTNCLTRKPIRKPMRLRQPLMTTAMMSL